MLGPHKCMTDNDRGEPAHPIIEVLPASAPGRIRVRAFRHQRSFDPGDVPGVNDPRRYFDVEVPENDLEAGPDYYPEAMWDVDDAGNITEMHKV